MYAQALAECLCRVVYKARDHISATYGKLILQSKFEGSLISMFRQALLSRCRPAQPLRISPRRFASFLFPRTQARNQPRLLLWTTAISLATYLTFSPRTVHLDADSQPFPEPSLEDSVGSFLICSISHFLPRLVS